MEAQDLVRSGEASLLQGPQGLVLLSNQRGISELEAQLFEYRNKPC